LPWCLRYLIPARSGRARRRGNAALRRGNGAGGKSLRSFMESCRRHRSLAARRPQSGRPPSPRSAIAVLFDRPVVAAAAQSAPIEVISAASVVPSVSSTFICRAAPICAASASSAFICGPDLCRIRVICVHLCPSGRLPGHAASRLLPGGSAGSGCRRWSRRKPGCRWRPRRASWSHWPAVRRRGRSASG